MISSKELFYAHLAQTSPAPMALEVEKAKGVYIYGTKGEKYIDLISGISVSNLGHAHPNVVAAVKQQADDYLHLMVYGEYIQGPQVQLATKISSLLPPTLNNVYFVNSGSEANEGAMKLAKRFTGRGELIHANKSYHGSTQGVLSIIGSDEFKQPFEPLLPGIKTIEFNEMDNLSAITTQTAAVIVEPIQGEAGVVIPTQEYLKALRAKCTAVGALLIFDEVQTGFGRTGSFWAWEQFGVQPDILTIAKGMGGGMPIGAFISSKEIMNTLTHHPVLGHITTFGGHPVCCAASLATIDTIVKEDLISAVPEKEALLKRLLVHPAIVEVRGKGLLFAVEFENSAFNFEVINECIKREVITDWFLFNDKSLRIAPPLIITLEELEQACMKIIAAIDAVLTSKNSSIVQ